MGNQIQTVTIILVDGRRASFTGPAFLTKEEVESGLEIGMVEMSFPEELPEGVFIEEIKPA